MAKKILVIHGPNLNLLGAREPKVYGKVTLDKINAELKKLGKKEGVTVDTAQTNIEGDPSGARCIKWRNYVRRRLPAPAQTI